MQTSERKNGDFIVNLRGHHLLCFHGYQGMGYSQKFIERMSWLKKLFLENPKTMVQVISEPDSVCDACPHLGEMGCIEGDPNKEAKIKKFDQKVMESLNIREGQSMTVEDAFERVEDEVTPDMLHELCSDCQWVQYGYCSSGIRKGFWN